MKYQVSHIPTGKTTIANHFFPYPQASFLQGAFLLKIAAKKNRLKKNHIRKNKGANEGVNLNIERV